MNIDENILHQVAARYIAGKPIEMQISGTDLQLESLQELLDVSKSLKESLDKNDNFEKSMELLKQKKQLTKRFQDITGIEWKL